MLPDAIGCLVIFILSVLLAVPTGAFMEKVYRGEKNLLDFLWPLEKSIFKFSRIDYLSAMNWKQYLVSLLVPNALWLIYGLVMLMIQGSLVFNPAKNPSMEWSLALHTSISFLTSTNLQHYSGESGATCLTQTAVLMFLQFVSAATSLSAAVAVVRGLSAGNGDSLGNFYCDFIRSLTRILLPLCILVSFLFICSGVPMTFSGPQPVITLQGDSVSVATGPVAAFLPIKELGSNGGGFFGSNDAHPFENPGLFSFLIHGIIIFILPMAFIFFIGNYLRDKKFARMILMVMTIGYMGITIPIVRQEMKGNPVMEKMGLVNTGNWEGKEARYGPFLSAFYAGENVAIPAGTVVGSHDSFMPLSGVFLLIGMNVDAFFGGLGTGWINIFILLTIALFVGSLMIGRTPELFGRNIGIQVLQITIAVSVSAILVPFVLTAVACAVFSNADGGNDQLHWLSNMGPHGFTTMLYEYISASAGNGSGFEALGDNTVFWNLTTSLAMLTGRFIPIIGAVWIAGLLKEQTYVVPSPASLNPGSMIFGLFLFIVICALNILSLLPALILGPVAEHFLLN